VRHRSPLSSRTHRPAGGSPTWGFLLAFVAFAAVVLLTAAATSLEGPVPEAAAPASAELVAPSPANAATTHALAPSLVPQPTTRGAIPLGYRIAIARLGIDLAIAEGDLQRDIADQRTPEGFAFHLPGSAFPGDGGNVYLYAHARRGMFLTLWDAQPGDEVALSTPTGILRYVVHDIFPRVGPTDVSSASPTPTERLTLQTSTGPSASDPRFVVFAFPAGH